MEKIKIESDDGIYPPSHECLISGNTLDNGYIRLSSGAFLTEATPDAQSVESFLSLVYRRDVLDGDGYVSKTKAVDFDILSAPKNANFTLLFSSVRELRAFFESICSELEGKIDAEENDT